MSFVVACAGRFQNHPMGEVAMIAVEDDDEPVIHTEVKDDKGTTYQVVRYSKAISLKNVTAKKDKDQFTVNADLSFRGKDQGPIEMVGQPSDSSGDTVLVPKDPSLQDKFKAKVTCTSDDGSCSDYFIDFFAKDGQTFYVDQYVQDSSVTQNQDDTDAQTPELAPVVVEPIKPSDLKVTTPTLPKIPVIKPVIQVPPVKTTVTTTTTSTTTSSTAVKKIVQAPVVPKPAPIRNPIPKMTTPTLPSIPVIRAVPTTTTTSTTTTSSTTSSTVKTKPTAAPIVATPDDDDQEEDIPDANPGRYVGTPDKEIVSIFETPMTVTPSKPEVTPVPTPTLPSPKTTIPPVQQAPSNQTPTQEQMGTPDAPQSFNQAIGMPSSGRLQNATNLLELIQDENYPLKIMWPEKKRYYSTQAMASFLKKIGNFALTLNPDNKLVLSDVSIQRGGPILTNGKMGHKGHQNGNDADISYLVNDSSAVLTKIVNNSKLSHELKMKEQWALMKAAYQTGQVAVIFMDPVIKHALCYEAKQEGDLKNSADRGIGYEVLRRIYPLGGHANHFHVRIKCGAGDATCRDQNWKYADSGCFNGSLQKKVKDEDDSN